MDDLRSSQGKKSRKRYITIEQLNVNTQSSVGSEGGSASSHSNASGPSSSSLGLHALSFPSNGTISSGMASAASSSSPLHGIDPLLLSIHEYLIYIGLSTTSSTLLKEVKSNPPLPYHQTSKLVALLFNYIHQLQFSSLLHDWNLLAEKFMFPTNESLQMKFSLVKYYFVTCVRKGKIREIENVLKEHAWWMYRHDTFKEWFVLPFLFKSTANSSSSSSSSLSPEITFHESSLHFDSPPVNDSLQKQSFQSKIPSTLKVYFEQQWFDLLSISLHNFLQTSIANSQQKPHLMTVESDYERKLLRLEKKQAYLERENFILERKMKAMYSWIRKKHRVQHKAVSRRVGSEDLDAMSDTRQAIQHKPQEILSDHTGTIDALKFSIGGLYLATASSEAAELKLYSSSSDHRSQSYSLSSRKGSPANQTMEASVATSVTLEWSRVVEPLLFVGMNNRKVKIFNASKKKKVSTFKIDAQFPNIHNISSNPVQQHCIAVSSSQHPWQPRGRLSNTKFQSQSQLITVDFNVSQTIRQFKTKTPYLHASYNHNGKLLAVAASNGTIQILAPGSQNYVIMEWTADSSPLSCVYFSCDETTLWTCSIDGAIKQWDMHKEGVCIREWNVDPKENQPISMVISPSEEQGNSFLTSTGSLFEEHMNEIFEETHQFVVDDNPIQFTCIDWNISEGLITTCSKNNTFVYNAPFVYN